MSQSVRIYIYFKIFFAEDDIVEPCRIDGVGCPTAGVPFSVSVAHVPYIAVEHRRGILLEAELLHQRSVLSKDKTQLVAECLAEFDDRIANSGQEQDIGMSNIRASEWLTISQAMLCASTSIPCVSYILLHTI